MPELISDDLKDSATGKPKGRMDAGEPGFVLNRDVSDLSLGVASFLTA